MFKSDLAQSNLNKWNYAAAFLHTILAVYILQNVVNKKVTKFEFKYKTIQDPASDLDYAMDIEPGSETSIKSLTFAFFAITAVAHILYATDFFGRGFYSSAIFGQGWNPYRWFEYSVTAGLMIYIIALVAGAKESSQALVAALIVPGLMLQGLTVERELKQNELALWSQGHGSKPEIDQVLVWANFAPAWLFFGLKWFIIFGAFFKLKADLEDEGKTLDPKITQLVWIQFIAFSLFGVIQTIQVYGWSTKRGNFSQVPYIQFEKAYIFLSLVAKAALGISVARLLN